MNIYMQIVTSDGSIKNITSKEEARKLMIQENQDCSYPGRVLPLPYTEQEIANPLPMLTKTAEVNAWWEGLSSEERQRMIDEDRVFQEMLNDLKSKKNQ